FCPLRLRTADTGGEFEGAGSGPPAGNGAGVGLPPGGSDGRQRLWRRPDRLREWRGGRLSTAGNGFLSRFPAREVPLYGAALWHPDARTRHSPAHARGAVLSAGPMGTQLGSEPHRRRRQLYRSDLVTGGGAAISADADKSRPTLINFTYRF